MSHACVFIISLLSAFIYNFDFEFYFYLPQTGRKSFSSSSYASGPVLVTASDSEFFDALINADFDAVAPQIISDLQVKRRMTFAPTNREAEKAEEALAMQKLGTNDL